MRLIIARDYDALSKRAASIIASHIILKPDSVLGLATGSTPLGAYRELVRMAQEEEVSFSEVRTFNLDEYWGLRKDDPQSYYYFMKHHLFQHVDISLNQVDIPDGMAPDVLLECERYESAIQKAGGIDLQLLGVGRNGHIGFNEPDVQFEALTHLVTLDEDTIADNGRFFSSPKAVPRQAISMGIKTIMHSKKILLIASGIEKSKILREILYGRITPEVPASVLQLHPDVTMLLDRSAAQLLNQKDHQSYKIFQ